MLPLFGTRRLDYRLYLQVDQLSLGLNWSPLPKKRVDVNLRKEQVGRQKIVDEMSHNRH